MSSTDQDPTSDTVRRRFDEVASLFGAIVPPAGSPVRPRTLAPPPALPQAQDSELDGDVAPQLVPPPKLRAPVAAPLHSLPSAQPLSGPATEPPKPTAVEAPSRPAGLKVTAPVKLAPVRPAKPAKAGAVPWPDGFAPRPNYKPTQKSRWLYWAFLIPFAGVVAVAVTFVDPHTIRSAIDQTLPRYLPAQVMQFFARPTPAPVETAPIAAPQAPAEAPQAAPAAAPDSQPAAAQPVVSQPVVTQPVVPQSEAPQPAEAPPTPAAPAPEPSSSLPAATPSIAPATVVPDVNPSAPDAPAIAPPPVDVVPALPASPDVAPSPARATAAVPTSPAAPLPAASAVHVTIYYRRTQSGAEAEARRVAAKIGNAETRASGSTSRSPLIYYFNAGDREAATAIARTLAAEGSPGWIVRAGQSRHEPGAIDILLP